MRILVVSGTFHPEPGGPPTYLYHLLPELVSLGHTISVVTYGDITDSHHYPYPVSRISRQQSILRRLVGMTREVLRQCRDADLLFVSDYGLPPAIANLWLRKPILLKVVTDFAWEFSVRHGWVPPDTVMDAFQVSRFGLRVEWLRAVQRAYVAAAQRVIVPSRYIQSVVTGWGVSRDKVQVIYNAPQLDDYSNLPDRAVLRRELGMDGSVIVTVARLTPWKGIDGLIRALPAVRRVVPDASLCIVGDGVERARLEALAHGMGLADHIRFSGQLPRREVARLLKAANVFALFSTYEGLPHVVLEAMAAGTPVVASEAGGTPEAIRHEDNGLLVPVGDEAALAEGIIRALTDDALVQRLVASGKKELERFSLQAMVEQTNALLQDVANAS